MFTFTIKRKRDKRCLVITFVGTWQELDAKYPACLILFTPEPLEE